MANKRGKLDSFRSRKDDGPTGTPQPQEAGRGSVTTGINMDPDTWRLLKSVAEKRQGERGGRASVSAVLMELVDEHRRQLEQEAESYWPEFRTRPVPRGKG